MRLCTSDYPNSTPSLVFCIYSDVRRPAGVLVRMPQHRDRDPSVWEIWGLRLHITPCQSGASLRIRNKLNVNDRLFHNPASCVHMLGRLRWNRRRTFVAYSHNGQILCRGTGLRFPEPPSFGMGIIGWLLILGSSGLALSPVLNPGTTHNLEPPRCVVY